MGIGLRTECRRVPWYLHWRAEMPQGKIKRLVSDRGFGFIEGDRDDLFFHHSALQGATIEELREGQVVEYEIGQGQKGPCAESQFESPCIRRNYPQVESDQSNAFGLQIRRRFFVSIAAHVWERRATSVRF